MVVEGGAPTPPFRDDGEGDGGTKVFLAIVDDGLALCVCTLFEAFEETVVPASSFVEASSSSSFPHSPAGVSE
jgi:hypothetical protein